jgi:hypothetical protein
MDNRKQPQPQEENRKGHLSDDPKYAVESGEPRLSGPKSAKFEDREKSSQPSKTRSGKLRQ